MPNRLQATLAAIDSINHADPNNKELAASELRVAWVKKLNPNYSDELLLAARGQHIARWTIPREQYPMDRGGYLRWREDLKKFHAQKVCELMAQCGYENEAQDRVKQIILKKDIKGNADTQTLEDALCLVFLETQFTDLRLKTPTDKMIEVVKKTWKKMSAAGQQFALSLPFTVEDKTFLLSALK